jgi:hypothetical protein
MNWNTNLPSWLQAPAPGDPGEALARGVSSGSQISHNFLGAQQVAMDQALMPLKMAEIHDAMKLHALDLQMKQDARQDFITGRSQEAGLLEVASGISDWSEPEVEAGIRQYGAENPLAIRSPLYGDLLKRTADARKEKVMADRWEAYADSLREKPAIDAAKEAGKNDRLDKSIGSREKIADQKNETALEISRMRAENRAFDLKDHALMAKYRGVVGSIFDSKNKAFKNMSPEEREQQATAAFQRIIRESELSKGSSKSERSSDEGNDSQSSSPSRIPVIGPDGKKYTLPEKQLDEAIKKGYQRLN